MKTEAAAMLKGFTASYFPLLPWFTKLFPLWEDAETQPPGAILGAGEANTEAVENPQLSRGEPRWSHASDPPLISKMFPFLPCLLPELLSVPGKTLHHPCHAGSEELCSSPRGFAAEGWGWFASSGGHPSSLGTRLPGTSESFANKILF